MQGKYDRNVEDLERARMEEGRYWGPRQSETGSFQFGTQFPTGQVDPSWFIQQQRFQQQFQPFQNQYSQIPSQYGFNPNVPQSFYHPMQQQFLQQPGFSSQIPYGYPNVPVQPGFQQTGINPFNVGYPQSTLHTQPYVNQQQLPYQQLLPQNIPGIYSQLESNWGEYPERSMYSQRGAMGRQFISRIFHRPPRNYRRSDELIRDEICKRLALTAEIDATDVDVIVKDGEVTLRGTVDDRFEKRLVEDIIENTFGVRDLLNEIRVGARQHDQEFTGTSPKGKEK